MFSLKYISMKLKNRCLSIIVIKICIKLYIFQLCFLLNLSQVLFHAIKYKSRLFSMYRISLKDSIINLPSLKIIF